MKRAKDRDDQSNDTRNIAGVRPALSIRRAEKSDLAEILHLYAQPDLDDGAVLSAIEAEPIFERMSRYPDYVVYVAASQGRIIGTFALLIMDNLGHRGTPSAVIEDIAVDPRYHRTGVGRVMVEYAVGLCRGKGCYKLVLSSNLKRDQAHEFYAALGFERHGYSFRITWPLGDRDAVRQPSDKS